MDIRSRLRKRNRVYINRENSIDASSTSPGPSTNSEESVPSVRVPKKRTTRTKKKVVTPVAIPVETSETISEPVVSHQGDPALLADEALVETANPIWSTAQIAPEDVLLEVLKLLSSFERKSFRLVCRNWYSACGFYEKSEKFCIGREHSESSDDIISTLSNSARHCFNLELYELHEKNILRTEFWENCGSRISSLLLRDCKISATSFVNILRRCSNLRVLELQVFDLQNLKKKFVLEDRRRNNNPSRFKNKSLQTLRIYFRFKWCHLLIWMGLLRKFFYVFPNISNLEFRDSNVDDGCMGAIDRERSIEYFKKIVDKDFERTTRRKLLKYFARDQMDRIAFSFLAHPRFGFDSLITQDRLTKIIEIAVDWSLDRCSPIPFLKFVQKQVNLNKLTVIINPSDRHHNIDPFLATIFKISSIREFQLFILTCGNLHWTINEWPTLLSQSNIEKLNFSCQDLMRVGQSPAAGCDLQFSNLKLMDLAIRLKSSDKVSLSKIIQFLNKFPKLKNLRLSHGGPAILKTVRTRLVELRSFIVENVVADSETEFPNVDLLTGLTKLTLLELPPKLSLKGNHFNNLKVLHLTIPPEPWWHVATDKSVPRIITLNLEYLQVLLQVSPLLEVVCLEQCIFTLPIRVRSRENWVVDKIVEFIAGLKYLKYLHLDVQKIELTTQNSSKIFQHCSSLKIFVCNDGVFFKDFVTEHIRQVNVPRDELIQRYIRKPV